MCACCGVMLCVSGACVNVVQLALMGVVSSAVAAMDAHRRVEAVAEHGLVFLGNLASMDANRVCVEVEHGPAFGTVREGLFCVIGGIFA